jgi:hypothetical protein
MPASAVDAGGSPRECGQRTVETLRLFEALFMLGTVAPLAAAVLTRPELPQYMS